MKAQRQEMDVREKAAWWIGELEDANAKTRTACLEWLRESPEHVKEFLLMSAMWEGLGGVDAGRRIDVEKLLAEASATVVALDVPPPQPSPALRGRGRWIATGIAASTVIVLGCLWVLRALNGEQTYETAVGEQRSFKLADGSVVQLNTRTHIEVGFDSNAREIALLDGEALFSVAHDAKRPFRVKVGTAAIQAIGTQFNVYRQAGRTTVSVIEGAVQVSGTESRVLKAGEQAALSTDGRVAISAAPDIGKAVAWRERRLVFRGESLETVAAEVNRYNSTLKISIDDETARRRQMIGVFAADDPESLVQFLEKDASLTVNRNGNTVSIRAAQP